MQRRKALILEAPKKMRFKEETLEALQPDQVLVRSVMSAFKHGTEMEAYHGSSPFLQRSLDHDLRLFLDNAEDASSVLYPSTLGNMTVGVVEEVGGAVRSFSVGDSVFGWLPVADWHVSTADKLYSLDGLTPEQAVCIDPANFAIGGVLDGDIRFRETVLVTGLGAIGLLAVQYCKLHGAKVYASSSFAQRRQLARDYGADEVIDTKQVKDLGLEIKQMTGGGVDAVFFCSCLPKDACECMMPNPGMLLDIASRLRISLTGVPVIGSSVMAMDAARAAGARPILVSATEEASGLREEFERFADLAAAVDRLVGETPAG